jgi:N-succinyldiaminopimelate aminotransferase
MPRYPDVAERTTLISGSVFEKFRSRMEEQGERLVKLHIGDSYAPPPYPLPIDDAFLRGHHGFNRYCDTFGIASLREALTMKLREDNGLVQVTPDRVLVTAGATNALSASVQSLVDPGDEVIVLSPYWPFFRGMVTMAGGRVVEVPFYTVLYDDPVANAASLLEPYVTDRTVAVYLNSPNNPSGKVLSRRHLEEVAELVHTHNLWLLSDEAYDGMTFNGREHISVGSLPGMFDRTLSIFTFSKVYMFSGLRLGYVVSDEAVIRTINKTMVHQLYSPSTVAQQMMVEPVRSRAQWREAFVHHSEDLRDMFLERLRITPPVPDGAYYFFFSVAPYLAGRSYDEVFDACMDAGVSVAPGADFGDGFDDYIRICFAGEPPNRLETAIERLNEVFPG